MSGGSSRPSFSSSSPAKPAASAKSTPLKSPEMKKVKVKNEVPTPKKSLDDNFGVVLCQQDSIVVYVHRGVCTCSYLDLTM